MGAKVKVRSDMILRQLEKKHRRKDAFFTEVKNGSTFMPPRQGLLRLDAVAFKKSWAHPLVTGYEIKVNRQDFLRDNKWNTYLQYCHKFFFACPKGLILPEELPPEVGLIYYNPDKNCISTKRKAVFRNIEMPVDILYYLVISRLDSDRHPFFSSKREFFEEWVADKKNKLRLSYEVSNKMTEKLKAAEKAVNKVEREIAIYKRDAEELKRIVAILHKYGISRWGIEDELEYALSNAIPRGLLNDLKRVKADLESFLPKEE